MKVRLAHTLYWGGPCPGRIIFDPWPFESLPRVGETVFVGDDETVGSEAFTIKRVYWLPVDTEVELGTDGDLGQDEATARERIKRLRELGFDFGVEYSFEREACAAEFDRYRGRSWGPLPNGLAVRHYRARFNAKRWTADRGAGREGDGVRFRRVRMYQWPFGVLHVLGRWGHA